MDMEEVKVRSEFAALGAALDICARKGAYRRADGTIRRIARYPRLGIGARDKMH